MDVDVGEMKFSIKTVCSSRAHFEEQLIKEVEKHPALYDKKHKEYFDTECKNQIWRQISETLNQSSDECRKRWKHLREAFVRKIKSSASESAAEESWPYFRNMLFLREFVRTRKGHTTEDSYTDGIHSENVYAYEFEDFNDVTQPPPASKKLKTIQEALSTIDKASLFIRQETAERVCERGENDADTLIGKTIVALLKEIPLENRDAARAELMQCAFDLKMKHGSNFK